MIFAYLMTGLVVGVLAGLLGIGGGGVVVPSLLWVFAAQHVVAASRVHLAIGTSLATIIFTASAAIRAQQKRGAIDWAVVRVMAPAALVGSLVSGYMAGWIDASALRLIFAICLFLIGVQLVASWRPRGHWHLPSRLALFAAGLVIGAVSALIGIGGGSLTVPFLSACNVDMKRAIAISTTLGLPIALFGALGFVLAGWSAPGRPDWSVGYVYLPALFGVTAVSILAAPLGVRWSHRLPVATLKRGFGILLLLVSFQILHGS